MIIRRRQRGSALIVALVLVAVALALTTIVTLRATLDAHAVMRMERRLDALNAAEAGLAQVIQELRWEPWHGDEQGELGRGKWSVVVRHDFSRPDYQIITLDAEATVMDQSRRVRMRVKLWPSLIIDRPSSIELVDWRLLP